MDVTRERQAATEPTAAQRFREIRKGLRAIRHTISRQKFFFEEIMGLNEDLNAKVDSLQATVDDTQAAVKKSADDQQAIIDDLRTQLATGQPGLTAEQGAALLDRLTVVQADIASTAAGTPPTTGGETPVPIPGDTGTTPPPGGEVP